MRPLIEQKNMTDIHSIYTNNTLKNQENLTGNRSTVGNNFAIPIAHVGAASAVNTTTTIGTNPHISLSGNKQIQNSIKIWLFVVAVILMANVIIGAVIIVSL